MLKGDKKYYFVLSAVFIVVIILQYMQPKAINWNRTYLKNDKIPFGCYAIFNLLESNFSKTLLVNKQTIYNINAQTNDTSQTLLIVNDKIDLSKLDVKSLFQFVKKGNNVLIAANEFNELLQDTFKLKTQYNWGDMNYSLDSLLLKKAFEIKYTVDRNNIVGRYVYPQVANESYFTCFDTTLFKVSTTDKNKKPVLIEASIGKGKLILGTLPDVFGNLFIVNHINRFYTYTLLSKVRNKTIIWDEYYKTFNVQQKNLFQFIFNNDGLYMAYSILIVGLLFFMLFEMKRIQRPIPIIKPLQNSTLEFVDVVSQVYFNSNNHKYIAEEIIQYFYFYIRKKFNLNTAEIDEEFFDTIHSLSGISKGEIKILFSYCQNLKLAPRLTQNDLLELNDRINNFKQKSNR